MFTSIAGKTVVVTGASRGIGRGIAKVFGLAGAKVALVSRDEISALGAVKELVDAAAEAQWFGADVSDWNSVQEMVERVAAKFGHIDILCANAGIFPQKKIIDMDPSEWDHVLSTNLKSTFLCVKACIPHFEKAGQGRVVLTSSITGPVTGYPGWAHYGASKSGQLGFLKTAAMELAKYNTTINAVMPGNILTEGLQDLGQSYLDTIANSIPLKRLGSVEDVANAALFFATNEASYITGQQIIIDGGQILPESLDAIAGIM